MRIVILGAGSIGCFVGGCWQAAGLDVGFHGRASVGREIATNGLTVSDLAGWRQAFVPAEIDYNEDPAILADADLVVVCVKSTATVEAAALIERHCRDQTAVLSLQNGISNVDHLRKGAGHMRIVAGVVGFNVVRAGPGHWHKSTSGSLIAGESPETERIAAATRGNPARLSISSQMGSIAWGKLLVNLNNPVNALSGLSLRDELMDRGFRRVLASSIREAVSLLKNAGIAPARITALPSAMLAPFIDTPDWFFNTVGLRLQKVDPSARSSMADDFAAGKPTEIDYLNGEIVRLAQSLGLPAPVNGKIVELVRQAETGGRKQWSSAELGTELGLQ